jgi:hypothetical protein
MGRYAALTASILGISPTRLGLERKREGVRLDDSVHDSADQEDCDGKSNERKKGAFCHFVVTLSQPTRLKKQMALNGN